MLPAIISPNEVSTAYHYAVRSYGFNFYFGGKKTGRKLAIIITIDLQRSMYQLIATLSYQYVPTAYVDEYLETAIPAGVGSVVPITGVAIPTDNI